MEMIIHSRDQVRGPTIWSHEMAKSCKEGMAAKQRRSGSEGHRFKIWCQQELITAESLLKSTIPLVICVHNINYVSDSLVDCVFAVHKSDVT